MVNNRQSAISLVDKRLKSMTFGMIGYSDIPDTSELCDIVDEIEQCLDDDVSYENALSELDEDFLTKNILN